MSCLAIGSGHICQQWVENLGTVFRHTPQVVRITVRVYGAALVDSPLCKLTLNAGCQLVFVGTITISSKITKIFFGKIRHAVLIIVPVYSLHTIVDHTDYVRIVEEIDNLQRIFDIVALSVDKDIVRRHIAGEHQLIGKNEGGGGWKAHNAHQGIGIGFGSFRIDFGAFIRRRSHIAISGILGL